ncbi:hypothetical protein [Streptomyces sp. ISL-98]|uniref:hypothetical protein n=1 Tax=Streptomyces sp. ISL-98 TaxID=2819192 RepID=UPI002034DD1C|nr:hypothetical protein [Streptomyces sp. ISL-98]
MDHRVRVIVEPPAPTGGRRVRIDGEFLGIAYAPSDLCEFLRRAGLDPEQVQLDDAKLFEWRGGGPDVLSRRRPDPWPALCRAGRAHDILRQCD